MIDKPILIPLVVASFFVLLALNSYNGNHNYNVIYYNKETDRYSTYSFPWQSNQAIYYPTNYTGIYYVKAYQNFVVIKMVFNFINSFDKFESKIRTSCAPFYDQMKKYDYVIIYEDRIISQMMFPCYNTSFVKELEKLNDPNYAKVISLTLFHTNITKFNHS